jgi:hypothetical protein
MPSLHYVHTCYYIHQGAYNMVKAAFVVLLCFTAGGALKEETDIRGALEELVRDTGHIQLSANGHVVLDVPRCRQKQ